MFDAIRYSKKLAGDESMSMTIKRPGEERKEPMSMYKDAIIAVDFDGTCVTHEYPKVGKDIGAEIVLRRLVKEGAKLILWTMRSGQELVDAADWFKGRGVELYGVNENPGQECWTKSPKAYAHLYIDDAALGVPLKHPKEGRAYVDWGKVERMLWIEEFKVEGLNDPIMKAKRALEEARRLLEESEASEERGVKEPSKPREGQATATGEQAKEENCK